MSKKKIVSDIPEFPVSYDWISNTSRMYAPRGADENTRRVQVEALLRADKQFQHLLRQCRDKWIVAVTIGRHTVQIQIYDPANLHKPREQRLSSSVNLLQSTVVQIDRNGIMSSMSRDDIEAAVMTYPMLYADRSLRPQEIAMLDGVETSMVAAQVQQFTEATQTKSDREAMDSIAQELDGKEWNSDTVDAVAREVRYTGRRVDDFEDAPELTLES